jgi:predicted RNase H-like nuclease (RuvC/YqgF family)
MAARQKINQEFKLLDLEELLAREKHFARETNSQIELSTFSLNETQLKLQKSTDEIADLANKTRRVERQNSQLPDEIDVQTQKISSLETENQLMNSHIEESNRTNQNLSKELKNLKQTYRKLEHSHNQSKEQNSHSQGSAILTTSDKE